MRRRYAWLRGGMTLGLVVSGAMAGAVATEVQLKDGRVLEGGVVLLKSVVEQPSATQGAAEGSRRIVMIDDNLRRTFVPKSEVAALPQERGQLAAEKFRLRQPRTHAASQINSVGTVDKVESFDEFGRRVIRLNMPHGPTDVVQVIDEITPTYARLRALDYQWEQSIATSSIPRETLHAILVRAIDSKSLEDRLRLVRLYLDADRHDDAVAELEQVRADFPGEGEERFAHQVTAIRQLGARNVLGELRLRQSAGQHRAVEELLGNFPTEGVAGEVLREVSQMLHEYKNLDRQIEQTKALLDGHMEAIEKGEIHDLYARVVDEIKAGLTASTTDRLAAYRRLADDEELGPPAKLALAASGWILGSDGATADLRIVLSAIKLRTLIADYLREVEPLGRDELRAEIRVSEGISAELVARLLAQLPPPLPLPSPAQGYPNGYVLGVPTVENEPEVQYLLQLPPEYDANRRYPLVVTLHGESTNPAQQIDWWCGEAGEDGQRHGQAGRHGYVVVAPAWTKPGQTTYGYTSREHAAVLNVLRDVFRRVSIDTDRVYLSGHSIGGDAAWDLGMAHPDLWAGVLPLVAVAGNYCDHYWRNIHDQPSVYAVGGEFDGDKTERNAMTYDRLLRTSGYNATIVEYLGRGHESFSDEILRVFEWMGFQRRDFFPQEFSCRTLRPWDNFFWWVEVDGFPDASIVYPEQWPRQDARPLPVEAKRTGNNVLRVQAGSQRVRIYFTPQTVDFSQRIQINLVGGRAPNRGMDVVPDVALMLEDARTRVDRQHPFWAMVEFVNGRIDEARQSTSGRSSPR